MCKSQQGGTCFEVKKGKLAVCDRAGVPEETPGEVTEESAVQLQQEILAFWRCQYHGLTTKNSSNGGVETA